MAKRIKLVVSDFHLCEGRFLADDSLNIIEDFMEDSKFIEFLNHYREGDFQAAEVELVLNGDFLNMIQVPYRGQHPSRITESISLTKLEGIFKGHEGVFNALKRFNECAGHSIVYVVGNHDLEMMWPGARRVFTARVGGKVTFYNTHYVADGIHIEHGHQLEATNNVDMRKIFITNGVQEPVLNLPWGSHFVLGVLLDIKKERPVIDSVRPFRAYVIWCLLTDTVFGLKMGWRMVSYFVRTWFAKSTFYSRLKTTWSVIKDMSLVPNVDDGAKKILRHHAGIHTVVFGHSHMCRYRQYYAGKIYLNTGTWNEATSLDLSAFGRSLKMTYAYIESDTEHPQALPLRMLKQWRGHWTEEEETFG